MSKQIQKLNFSQHLLNYKYAIYIQIWKFDPRILDELKIFLQSMKNQFQIVKTKTVFVESSSSSIYTIFISPRLVDVDSSIYSQESARQARESEALLKLISYQLSALPKLTVLRIDYKWKFNISLEQLLNLPKSKLRFFAGFVKT